MELANGNKNPYAGYLEKLVARKKRVNPIHEVVDIYLQIRGMDWKKVNYPKLCKEAKNLLEACGESLEDALWSIDRMKYKADRGSFNWTISTCLKHPLKW